MPRQTSSQHSVKSNSRITNKEMWSSVIDNIETIKETLDVLNINKQLITIMEQLTLMRESIDDLKTITYNRYCMNHHMENYNLMKANNMCNPCQNIQKYSCHWCERERYEVHTTSPSKPLHHHGRRCMKLHAVKSLINVENRNSISSAESSIDSLLTSFIEQKTEPDEADCAL
ncbi:unnamed protein product [Auanema sp. JU1783]|nr:unnamed protein product [Auanema sp. JU1783]